MLVKKLADTGEIYKNENITEFNIQVRYNIHENGINVTGEINDLAQNGEIRTDIEYVFFAINLCVINYFNRFHADACIILDDIIRRNGHI